MNFISDPFVSQWIAPTCAILVVSWILMRYVRRRFSQPKADDQRLQGLFEVSKEDYPRLQIPSELHLEMAMHPPSGLHCSNPMKPHAFDNEFCWGSYVVFHAPQRTEGLSQTEVFYRDYFKTKKRLWELRLEIHFKKAPPPDVEMFFGTELEDYVPLAAGADYVMKAMVAMVRSAFKTIHHSVGDNPKVVTGELERPGIALPMWGFDQFIESAEGETPPDLMDPQFPEMGKKRYRRVDLYKEEIAAMKRSFRPGATYTFSSWGVARFANVLKWQLCGIPLLTPIDLSTLAPRPPVHAVLYTLKPSADGETRHLQSRKNYYFSASLWSSSKRPERARFDELTGSSMLLARAGDSESASGKGFFSRFVTGSFACCAARPR